MKILEIENAGMSLAEGARKAGEEPIVITEHGKPIAVLLPLENTDLETAFLSSNSQFLELIERSRSRLRTEGGLTPDEVRQQLGLR